MPINLQYNKTPYPKKYNIQKNIKNIKNITKISKTFISMKIQKSCSKKYADEIRGYMLPTLQQHITLYRSPSVTINI
jgi:hypothetical protein